MPLIWYRDMTKWYQAKSMTKRIYNLSICESWKDVRIGRVEKMFRIRMTPLEYIWEPDNIMTTSWEAGCIPYTLYDLSNFLLNMIYEMFYGC